MTKTVAQVFQGLVGPVDQQQELACAMNACEAAFYAQTDRVTNKWHHYLAIYDRHLSRFRDQPVRLLEIGAREGGSLQMWRRYLGPRAIIHGLDIDPRCAQIADESASMTIGSQDDASVLDRIVDTMGGVDVVIDDGSHFWSHQIATFQHLYSALSPTGVYLCEDTHTSYWPGFEGETASEKSFVEYMKRCVDDLHVWYRLEGRREGDEQFARQTRSITFYDSMVVVERELRPPPRNVNVGKRRLA